MRVVVILLLLLSCSEPFDLESKNVSKIDLHNSQRNCAEPIICYFNPRSMPQYPGGLSELFQYINSNLRYPHNRACVEGKVYVSFVVELDGSITELEIAKGLGGEFDRAALEVFENVPKWTPAKYYDQPVRVRFMLPITFTF